jgi:hypothetical protein
MTTNVPQDVKDFIRDICEMPEPVTLRRTLLVDLDWFEGKLTELLRAQRAQGAEPVGELLVSPHGICKFEKSHGVKLAFGKYQIYASTPQANALVEAFGRKAAEICDECVSFKMAEWSSPQARPLNHEEIKSRLLEAIPADAEAALREVCMNVAYAVRTRCDEVTVPQTDELESIVNSVLGEGGK